MSMSKFIFKLNFSNYNFNFFGKNFVSGLREVAELW